MSLPETMLAAYIEKTGGTESIQVGQLPVPPLGPTDVLVRMEASEVNYIDLLVRSGAHTTHMPMPFVLGRDVVGTVVQLGAGVSGFAVDDRVWSNSMGHQGRQGTWSEYVVVSAERLYPLPAQADPVQAAAALHGAGTAHIGLVREARLAAGETVFVKGGGGAVGSAVIQMATTMGARVLAAASEEDRKWCQSCGADAVFDYHDEALYDEVRRMAPDGVDVWWDCSGHHDFEASLPLVARGGRVIIMSGADDEPGPRLPVAQLYSREITLHGFAISNATVADLATAARMINRMLAVGLLQTRIAASHPLTEAVQAHQAMEVGGVRGRIVVTPPAA